MRRLANRRVKTIALALALAGVAWQPAAAQIATLRGTVRDSTTQQPLAGVRIELRGQGGALHLALSDERGRYQLPADSGPAAIAATRIGYAPLHVVGIEPGRTTPLDLTLAALGVPLDPVIVSASRSDEAALGAAASTSVVLRDRIESQAALTPVENVRAVTGVDLATKGLIQHSYAVRGERGSVSGAMLTLADFRNAEVPSIAVNIPYLVATTNEDLDHIEVVRGPGAALYGPGADRGVLHFITRSPFESAGGSLTLTGGGRSLFEGTVRYAAVVSSSLAFKISADYLTGRDWSYADPVEAATRADSISAGARPDTLRIGARDPSVSRAGGELRVDWRPGPRAELVALAGMADAIRAVELGGDVGSVQARNWRYSYAQARLRVDQLTVNLFANVGGTGDSYLLRNGHRLVDSSRVLVGQVQNGAVAGPVQLVYGADARWTDPRTGGTIDGEHEANDRMTEIGAYAHGTAAIGPALSVVAALRADHHSRLDDVALSPRVGLVFHPSPAHAIRLTYNRAFTSPDANTLFLDLPAASASPYPALVRASSVPQGGYTFRHDCGGVAGLCMYSPFAADPTAALPASAPAMWQQLCASNVVPQICGIPAPTGAQVGTVLAALDPNSGSFSPVAAVGDIPALRRTITNSVELGWKAEPRERLGFSADLYMNRVSDPIGARFAATPNAFFDATTLATYLATYMSPAQAAALAAGMAQLPLGTVSPRETTHPTDLLILSRQGGAYTIWGLDLAITAPIGRALTVDANASWLSRNVLFPTASDTAALGVPRRKASLALTYRMPERAFELGLAARYVDGFPIRTGLYDDRTYGEHVRHYAVLDARVAFPLPAGSTSVVVEADNLLDNRHQEFIGAPALGRLLLTRLRVAF